MFGRLGLIDDSAVSRVYSPRVWSRADEAADTYHNFPIQYDEFVLKGGSKAWEADDYVIYRIPGVINGVPGEYQIGAKIIDGVEVIDHRFFKPAKK